MNIKEMSRTLPIRNIYFEYYYDEQRIFYKQVIELIYQASIGHHTYVNCLYKLMNRYYIILRECDIKNFKILNFGVR
jgi:hypothetical protein